jgi:hypothetical protein
MAVVQLSTARPLPVCAAKNYQTMKEKQQKQRKTFNFTESEVSAKVSAVEEASRGEQAAEGSSIVASAAAAPCGQARRRRSSRVESQSSLHAHRSKADGKLVRSRKSSIFSSSWFGQSTGRKRRRRPVDSEQGLGPDEPVSKSECLQSAGVEQGARPRLATLSTSVLSGEGGFDPQLPYVNEVSVNSFMLFMTTPSMLCPKPPPGLVMLV